MDEYFCLRIQIAPRELPWLGEQLALLGFPVFEEQRHGARAELLVYDQDGQRLAQLAGALQRAAAAAFRCSRCSSCTPGPTPAR